MTRRLATPSRAADAQRAPSGDVRITVAAPIPRDEAAPSSTALAELQRDAVALTWDLTVHQLHQAFARCLAPAVTGVVGSAAAHELAQTRLNAARHAVEDVRAALERMACGTYGVCQQCGRMIAADRLHASPTARWCAACYG